MQEELVLCVALLKHQRRVWRQILEDDEFADALSKRRNISIKDKLRTILKQAEVKKKAKKEEQEEEEEEEEDKEEEEEEEEDA